MSRQPDLLFVALTRPPMKWGVPFIGLCWNTAITVVFAAGIWGNPTGFLIWPAVHAVMRAKAAIDPHFFHLWTIWFRTKARSMTGHVWGGSRLQPSPTYLRNAREMRSGV